MKNIIVKVEDLQVGDEVIVKGYDLRYLKILREPKKKAKLSHYGGTYKRVKCLEMYDKVGGHSNANREIYYDFNWSGAWLVKRESEI